MFSMHAYFHTMLPAREENQGHYTKRLYLFGQTSTSMPPSAWLVVMEDAQQPSHFNLCTGDS